MLPSFLQILQLVSESSLGLSGGQSLQHLHSSCQSRLIFLLGDTSMVANDIELKAQLCSLSFPAIQLWANSYFEPSQAQLKADSENTVFWLLKCWEQTQRAVNGHDAAEVDKQTLQLARHVRFLDLTAAYSSFAVFDSPWFQPYRKELQLLSHLNATKQTMFKAGGHLAGKGFPPAWATYDSRWQEDSPPEAFELHLSAPYAAVSSAIYAAASESKTTTIPGITRHIAVRHVEVHTMSSRHCHCVLLSSCFTACKALGIDCLLLWPPLTCLFVQWLCILAGV